jgi:sialate O-acetylesterase
MIRRVAPFALKGFLYYQGEEDDLRAADYGEMMCYLIDQWHTDWRDDGLFFLFVQLPMWASRSEFDEGLVSKNWPVIRENQYKVSKIIANTGMVVSIDRGEFDNIHPLDKQTIGFRLALQALRKVYGKDVEADGPVFRKAKNEGAGIRVYFDNAASGLVAREVPDGSHPLTDGKETADIAGFEVAGADGVYHTARVVIDGETVLVASPDVPRPERVRYAWIKWGPTPLYAKNGLPVMPFRSDKFSNPRAEEAKGLSRKAAAGQKG